MRPGQGNDRDHGSDDDHGPEQDWSNLGRLVRERRTDLGLTQAEIQSAGGPSPATLYLIESGRRGSYRPQVLRRLERALGWRAGSVRRALAGGRPQPEGDGEAEAAPPGLPAPPAPEDRTHAPDVQAWMVGFRRLPLSQHDKLLVLSRLLEEVIAELSTGVDDPRSGLGRASRP
jgi:transcriptional regulator with XRE-family HTH domain